MLEQEASERQQMLAVIEELERHNLKCRSALQFLYELAGRRNIVSEQTRWDMAIGQAEAVLSEHPRGCSLMFFDAARLERPAVEGMLLKMNDDEWILKELGLKARQVEEHLGKRPDGLMPRQSHNQPGVRRWGDGH